MGKCSLLPRGWRLPETEHLQSNCCCGVARTTFAVRGARSLAGHISAFTLPLPLGSPLAPRTGMCGRYRKVSASAPARPPRRPRYEPFSSAPALPMVAELSAALGPVRQLSKAQVGAPTARTAPVPGGGGGAPGLPSPPGGATPPADAQIALIKKLNTDAAAATASSSSLPSPLHRYSAAVLLNPPVHGLN